ncbi:hypothetical protein ACUOCP_39485, partial [Escherichia sp. R-CC3]
HTLMADYPRQQNAAVLEVELSSAELTMLDKAYPAPKGKTALDMV